VADASDVDVTLIRPGGISYLHIPAVDVRAAAAFYASVFDWAVSNIDSDRPSFVDGTGHLAGAWMSDQAISREPGLLVYVYVVDIDDAVARIAAGGGQIIAEPQAEGDLRVATFRDPAGNVLGLWQAT
jgi:predicted enzyme related to lactoylglutathione lyase